MRAAWLLVIAAACGHGSAAPDASPDAPRACASGPRRCDGNTLELCDDGVYRASQTCASACSPDLGCVLCLPGTGTCDGPDLSHACNAVGTGYVDVACDPVQGMTCGVHGVCEGECAPQELGQSYIGCEYYPTVTGNGVPQEFSFAVAVANTGTVLATVTVEDGALAMPLVFTVPPGGVQVQRLPWRADLKLCLSASRDACFFGRQADGALAVRGAYHLRSTVPVTVYQFNPLEYVIPGSDDYSGSNDASLLLPTNAWRGAYVTASWGVLQYNPSELAVTAWHDGTHVTITTRADTLAGGGAPAFATGVPQTVTLDAGDVVEITARAGDLTGSMVDADQPVQVIGAHYAANVPLSVAYSDHLEESMFPIDALGSRYVVTAPAVITSPNGKPEIVRVIATAAGTHLTYDPPQPGAPTTIASPGDFVELPSSAASFVITADQKVMVAQYMEGEQATSDNIGDPSLALAVPIDQFRSAYRFHAPTNYSSNYLDVVAPAGTTVSLDGAPLAFTPIATTGFALARVTGLDDGPAADGNHAITGSAPFGITVYGYGLETSYWYPGGLELHPIIVN